METLGQIETIRNNIKAASVNIIRVLHRIVFEADGDRKNRQRLRDFGGFDFPEEDAKYVTKLDYIKTNFRLSELISAANVLGIQLVEDSGELAKSICSALLDINSLVPNVDENDDSDEEDESEVDEDKDDNDENGDEMPKEDDDEDNQSSDEDKSRNERERVKNVRKQQVKKKEYQRVKFPEKQETKQTTPFALNFRDIEDSIRPFDGSDNYPIDSWLADFEETSTLMGWDDLKKLIFGKKCLKGMAKSFIQSERGITTWQKLKKELRKEFSDHLTSAQVHRNLSTRKMKKEETIKEYYICMRELASRGSIEDDALIQYVIDGVSDEDTRKFILYGAQGIDEFKRKMKVFTSMKTKTDNATNDRGKIKTAGFTKSTNKTEKDQPKKCFNCGDKGHMSSDCPHKSEGTKCFNCNQFGHIASKCPSKKNLISKKTETTKGDAKYLSPSTRSKCLKTVKILNNECEALIDTGCDISLIRKEFYDGINGPELSSSQMVLSGFGQDTKVTPLGVFTANITIDQDEVTTKIYVIRNEDMKHQMIIGNETLHQGELTVNRNGVFFKLLRQDLEVMNILIDEEEILTEMSSLSEQVRPLVEDYRPNKTEDVDVEMKIVLAEYKTVRHNPRLLPLPDEEFVEKQIEEWIQNDIIEPCSSEFASPVVIAKKKDGGKRLCIDYRAMNNIVVKDRYPLPVIEDIMDQLQDAQVFSTIDLKNGFLHVPVELASRKYTSFVVRQGQYQFKRMPFGLCNSPSVFQRYINAIFRPLIKEKKVLIYLDDIIIPSVSEESGIERLREVLEIASKYGLELNLKKCKFLRKTIEFLGHIIEEGKIYASPSKIEAVLYFPVPRTTKEVQRFLGLTGYFRKFIRDYSLLAKPLSDLLKKDVKFEFLAEQRQSFDLLKKSLTENPVLKIYNRHL